MPQRGHGSRSWRDTLSQLGPTRRWRASVSRYSHDVSSTAVAVLVRSLSFLLILPWVEPIPKPMASATALKCCGCHVLPPSLCASGELIATRLLPGWGHTSTPSQKSVGGALDVVVVPLNPGISGIEPSLPREHPPAGCIQPRPRGHRCCCCPCCRGDDRMVSWRSKPRVGMYVFSGACPILSVRNSGSTQQKKKKKSRWGKKALCDFSHWGCVLRTTGRENIAISGTRIKFQVRIIWLQTPKIAIFLSFISVLCVLHIKWMRPPIYIHIFLLYLVLCG